MTYYSPSVGLGACGSLHQDSEFVAALPQGVFDPSTPGGNPNANPLCGRTATVCVGDRCVDVEVVDRCKSFPFLL